ncbi:MAG TPA: TonB-dependent receptor plug domain-containing protein, partial [Chitinophagaceae bacterium]|nr:TonB-dependent receptor plug domain-containing protein [Chitinophagaceae bacterium]
MFFQKSFLGLLLLSINIVLSAQNSYTFSGRITDAKSGSLMPGASVVISDEDRAVAADSLGFFQFKNLRAGHHIVEVSFAGYASIVLHIDLVQNLEKNLTLQPLVVENQGVTVTGVAGATIIKKTPAPVYLVKKSMLLQSANTNIIDALTRVPGVAQLSSGPAISKPFIRGLGYNRVLILNDGVRQEGQQWGDEHGVEVDEMSLARAEVLKGPASFMYGSDALAGVINLITNVPVANNKIMGNITSNFQSNNNLY